MADIHLRKDSLGLIASPPTLYSSKIHRRPIPDRTKEQGKRTLKQPSQDHLEPLPNDLLIIDSHRDQDQDQDQEQEQDVDEVVDLYASHHYRSKSLPSFTVAAQPLELFLPPSQPTAPPLKPHRQRKSRRTASEPSNKLPPRKSWDIAMSRPTSLLIASLGNPPPYHSTRHSAAHLILKSLQQHASLPSFTQKVKPYGGGHVSVGTDFTLYQSAVQMNISGPPLLKAWKQFLLGSDGRNVGLVVLHDEMEVNPGQFKVRRGNGSARGHNGIKSVQATFQGAGLLNGLGDRFMKIGVGIGRPGGGSRESRDVTAFVLGQLTRGEKEGLEQGVGECERLLWQEVARIGQMG